MRNRIARNRQKFWQIAVGLTTPEDVRVVILEQDPYPAEVKQNGTIIKPSPASGLVFSSEKVSPLCDSLKIIVEELKADLQIDNFKSNGNLESWAKQDVLLLNYVMTIKDKAKSHDEVGWQSFIDIILEYLAKREDIVFLLWGKYAIEKKNKIKTTIDLFANHANGARN